MIHSLHNDFRQALRLGLAVLVFGVVLLLANGAWAAPGDGPAEFNPKEFIASILNFMIYIGIIVFLGGAAIQGYFRDRRAKLTAGIDEARELRERAEAELAEYRAKLDAFGAEKEQILEDYRAVGARERDRLIEEARSEADRIREDAERAVEIEIRQARVALEKRMIDRALSVARERVASRLTPEVGLKLIDAGVREVADAAPRADAVN